MSEFPVGLWAFLKSALREPVFWVGGIIWTVIADLDGVLDRILKPLISAQRWDSLGWLMVSRNWSFSVWLSGILLLLLFSVIKKSYGLYESARRKAEGAILEFEEFKKPRLKISVDPHHPDFIIEDPKIPARRVRIKVKNESGKSIDDPLAQIVSIDPQALPGYFPIPLLPTHRKAGPINPGDHFMYDVFYKNLPEDVVYLTHGVSGLNNSHPVPFPARERRIVTIAAGGRDCPLKPEKFVLSVLDNGSIELTEFDKS